MVGEIYRVIIEPENGYQRLMEVMMIYYHNIKEKNHDTKGYP